ncbi:MAG TPA: EAL domain-containing protein [Noviherbaspirillum sp.]|uniref:EAL and HDOD domain-containing protein n=1 Tax=Noviherbaspirillum sp. TaxID=1926288 RepID=UPI002B46C05D|nr:EAL domain-containing protein [Noviherbaspirillum sp.]HJV88366.1 EAL domain-containing protein [Noviherbaspirillum sp.]
MDDFVSNTSPEIDTFTHSQPGREFFLARQPILTRDQELFAYELLFRNAAAGPANVTDDVAATAAVIAHASELGMENVIGASSAFINVDATVLMSDFIQFLPRQGVVLEILETVRVTDRLITRIEELSASGYVFALDDVIADSDDVQRLLPLVELIKVDISGVGPDDLSRLSEKFRRARKKLLAEKVENLAQYETCLELGFDYFQGYYFAKPYVLTGKKLSPSQMTIMRLMAQIISNADTGELERSIKRDASLGLMLLRLVSVEKGRRIDSLRQALEALGSTRLQRWLQILLYAEFGKSRNVVSPLFILATTRGKLLELMAEKVRPVDREMADTAFTVGIMSLMDTLLGLPMKDALARVHVTDEVRAALLARRGIFGDMLKLVECIEHIEEAGRKVPALLKKLQLSSEDLYELQLAAFEWSSAISNHAN